jgi:hypothetical protein
MPVAWARCGAKKETLIRTCVDYLVDEMKPESLSGYPLSRPSSKVGAVMR